MRLTKEKALAVSQTENAALNEQLKVRMLLKKAQTELTSESMTRAKLELECMYSGDLQARFGTQQLCCSG